MNRFVSLLAGASTFLTVFCYLLYILRYVAGFAGKPLGEESMSSGMVIFGSLIPVVLPVFLFWCSSRFDLLSMRDGYSRASEIIFCLLVILWNITALNLYFNQFSSA